VTDESHRDARTDAELLRADRRDPEAFRQIYRRHYRAVHARLQREIGDAEIAAELTAETFAQAWFSRRRFRDEASGSAVPWLFGIAANLVRTYRRRQRVEQKALGRLGLADVSFDEGYEQVDDRDAADRSRARIQAGLDALPEAQREAVRLHVLQGLSYTAIAERFGCDPALIRVRVSRGLRALRSAATTD
jgi:RNA polymerase sigma factor (sigma-70 family)